MPLLTVFEAMLPHLIGKDYIVEPRRIPTHEEETLYEVSFIHQEGPTGPGVRMVLFIHLDDLQLSKAMLHIGQGVLKEFESLDGLLQQNVVQLLPYLKEYNGHSTDYPAIARLIQENRPAMAVNRIAYLA